MNFFTGRRVLLSITSCLLLLVSGCVRLAPGLSAESRPEPGTAYIYGRFHIKAVDPAALKLQLNLVMREKNSGAEYSLRFSPRNDVFALALPPGTYFLKGWTYTAGGRISKEKPFPVKGQPLDLVLAANTSHYLGDFLASAFSRIEGADIAYYWKIENIRDLFDSTSADYVRRFPRFRELQTVRLIAKLPAENAQDMDDLKDLLPKQRDHAKDLDDFRDLMPSK